MTEWSGPLMRSVSLRWPDRLPRLQRERVAKPPDYRAVIVSYAMTMVSICLLVLLVNLTLIAPIQHFTAQHRLYGELRRELAEGSVPIGQTDVSGHLIRPGSPVALLSIPALGIREVVVEGTSSGETMKGVGHRRDTPLPGQPGVSVLMGRAAAYGGVFKHLHDLAPGSRFTVQTGQGIAEYRVLGARSASTRLPVLASGQGRLTLMTASGGAFRPNGVLRVDAELVSKAFPRPAAVLAPGAIRPAEQALRGDTSPAFALSWLVELLVLLAVAATWAWKRWLRAATWIVFGPVLAVVALLVAGDVCTFLPNLM
ncbi:sortase [Nocardioides sp. BP30]|uniref:sortase n=1 Tax=Nocardioides sp. BP30 TaxID=3036374 RepID=UPI002468A465|nr:sortase [Nocardioides sp. BP30]WGL52764.1 sortase [Nocardioides sp. BP30]